MDNSLRGRLPVGVGDDGGGAMSINIGARVRWEQRPPRDRIAAKMLTGIVREFQWHDGIRHAIVETEPDGRLTMPSLDKLIEAQP